MDADDPLRAERVLLLALAPQDARAIVRALENARITAQPCPLGVLAQEIQAGVGAIVMGQEAMSAGLLRTLAPLIEEQPLWNDIPLIILRAPRSDADKDWTLIQTMTSLRNATFLERPMLIATLIQAVRVALRGRRKQYALRDQMRDREQLLALAELNERRLSDVLNNTRMSVFFLDERQDCIYMNAAAEVLTGYRLAELQGRPLHDMVHHSHPDGSPYLQEDCPIDRAFPEDSQTRGEEIFVHKDGHFFPVAFAASPIRESNVSVGTVLEVRDISEKRAVNARLQMMMSELNHRVKNTLATVQSIFLQSLNGEALSEEAKDRIMARVMALSRSHDLLTENSWVSASLREVVRRALEPFGATMGTSGRFSISGEDFDLHPKPALAIAMGLHELATNAVKYGALSVEEGTVALSWAQIPGAVLRVTWVERGGPPVALSPGSGFGRRLIERGLAHELGGEARFDFQREGVVCMIDVPMATALVPSETRVAKGEDVA